MAESEPSKISLSHTAISRIDGEPIENGSRYRDTQIHPTYYRAGGAQEVRGPRFRARARVCQLILEHRVNISEKRTNARNRRGNILAHNENSSIVARLIEQVKAVSCE